MTAPPPGEAGAAPGRGVVASGLVVARWSVVSRATGLVRLVVTGAVLGPTYLANTYQGLNLVPSLVYEFFTGSLLLSMLVPPLVRLLDLEGRAGVRRCAEAVLGVVLLGFSACILLLLAAAPLVLAVFFSTVTDAAQPAAQRQAAVLLLVLLLPQLLLYGVAAVAGAVLNAQGRFALAAGAPALENLGIIATLVAVALVHGTGSALSPTDPALLALLGAGTTGAVALHAAAVWAGAARSGVVLRPRWAGWRDPDCRAVLAGLRPSLGYAWLNSGRVFAVMLVANRLPGGVLALQLARSLRTLPVALVARPLAVAALPALSVLWARRQHRRFQDEVDQVARLTALVTVPAGLGLLVLAWPLAQALALEAMSGPEGTLLLCVAVAALALSVPGEALFVLSTHASYAAGDASAPLRAMATRAAVLLPALVAALLVPAGPVVLALLGLGLTLGDLAGARHLRARLQRRVAAADPTGSGSTRLGLPGLIGAAAAMSPVAVGAALAVPLVVPGQPGLALGAVVGAAAGAAAFLLLVRRSHGPELRSVLSRLRRSRPRADGAAGGPLALSER